MAQVAGFITNNGEVKTGPSYWVRLCSGVLEMDFLRSISAGSWLDSPVSSVVIIDTFSLFLSSFLLGHETIILDFLGSIIPLVVRTQIVRLLFIEQALSFALHLRGLVVSKSRKAFLKEGLVRANIAPFVTGWR